MNPDIVSSALPAALWLPILTAAIALLVRNARWAQRSIALTTHSIALIAGLASLTVTGDGTIIAEQISGWPAGISIPFVLDTFASLMISVAALMVLVSSLFAMATRDDDDEYYHPLVLVLSAGVYGAFLTGDLFNLFVMIEVALIPSYVLLTRSGRAKQLTAGRIYLTVNLLVSTVLLMGIGMVYGTAGTVNLAELAGAASDSPATALAVGVVLVALGAKAALVPVHSWLPRTYPFASVAVTALLSGLLTKIGVYAIFRIYGIVFHGSDFLSGVWLVVLLATMVVGVLGALGESSMRSILSFHMTSQVGYIMLPLAFFGPAAVAAGVFYMIHHIIVKAGLFLATGAVEHHAGTGNLSELGGYARRQPVLGLVFIIVALSLVGVPPFSGFVAKMTLTLAAVDTGTLVAAGFAIAVSLFTLLSMLKIWNGAFWGPDPKPRGEAMAVAASDLPPDPTDPGARRLRASVPEERRREIEEKAVGRVPISTIIPAALLAGLTIVIGLGADVLYSLAEAAAGSLTDPTDYVEAVTGQ